MPGKILIVDDEEMLTSLLSRQLSDCGYTPFTANSGEQAMDRLKCQPDLILLDINMPDMDGLSFCRKIREAVSCPIIFLTARITEQDKLTGFQTGGDDYITKPFSLAELMARVEAHLRREARVKANIPASILTSRGLVVNLSSREVSFDGKILALTKKEFDIIELLMTHTNQVFDRERIYEQVWGLEAGGDNSVVREHIRKIRAKLVETTGFEYIETVWGMGYKWKNQ